MASRCCCSPSQVWSCRKRRCTSAAAALAGCHVAGGAAGVPAPTAAESCSACCSCWCFGACTTGASCTDCCPWKTTPAAAAAPSTALGSDSRPVLPGSAALGNRALGSPVALGVAAMLAPLLLRLISMTARAAAAASAGAVWSTLPPLLVLVLVLVQPLGESGISTRQASLEGAFASLSGGHLPPADWPLPAPRLSLPLCGSSSTRRPLPVRPPFSSCRASAAAAAATPGRVGEAGPGEAGRSASKCALQGVRRSVRPHRAGTGRRGRAHNEPRQAAIGIGAS